MRNIAHNDDLSLFMLYVCGEMVWETWTGKNVEKVREAHQHHCYRNSRFLLASCWLLVGNYNLTRLGNNIKNSIFLLKTQ